MRLSVILVIFCIISSCGNSVKESVVNEDSTLPALRGSSFSYFDENEEGTTLIKTTIKIDSVTLDMSFETGALGLSLDTSVASKLFNLDSLFKTREQVEFSYSSEREMVDRYFCDVAVPFGGDTLHYNYFFVHNIKDRFGLDGFMSIPRKDNHIWNFDFENCAIVISEDTVPESYTFKTAIKRSRDKYTLIGVPFTFVGGGDTLICSKNLIFDTGTDTYGISCFGENAMSEKERDFFQNKSLLSYYDLIHGKNYHLGYYHVLETGSLNDTLLVRDFPAYYDDMSIAGMDFLTKYDIAMDLSKDTAYFTRNTVGNLWEYYHQHGKQPAFLLRPINGETNAVVADIPVSRNAYLAGIRRWDVIMKFDGKPFHEVDDRFFSEDSTKTRILDIVRFGKEMRIEINPKTPHI